VINLSSITGRIKDFEYAVRGELAIKASEYMMRLKEGEKLPFDEVVFCNIGNPQQLGQKPITFTRQGIARPTLRLFNC
jgi:alanine transaminase